MKKVVSILLIMMLMLGGLLPACAIDAKVRIMDLTHITVSYTHLRAHET